MDDIQKKVPVIYANDEIDLLEYGLIVWYWRKIIVLFTALIFVLVVVFTFFMQPVFEAKVTLLPAPSGGNSDYKSIGNLAASFGFSVPMSDNSSDLYKDILTSRYFLGGFAHDTIPTLEYPQGRNIKDIFEITTSNKDSLEMVVFNKLVGKIKYKEEGALEVLTVTSFDPLFSSALANLLIERLKLYNDEKRVLKIKRHRQFIEGRIKTIERELKDARDKLTTFRKKNMRIDITHAPHLLDKQQWLLQEVNTKQQVYLMLKKEYEVARIEEEKEKPYMQVLDKAVPPSPIYKPNKKLVVIAVTFMAFFVSILLSFIIEFLLNNDFIPNRYKNYLLSLNSKPS